MRREPDPSYEGLKRRAQHKRRTTRRERAGVRLTARQARSVSAQLAVLDGRLGDGLGARAERARLAKLSSS
jgi:hypothetical protein